ncbi:hypothetical protein H257_00198 [Aphanomyces astaci]|uniref:Uncharacterized protein n=1 Tax=Aphanomyces astaci TaxID=112090 RepID=W4HAT1_APHAT|nr:hypothetical protein H257_00198 [Aphanomyces astaci]ETV88666.1 hypothetical protein H257_00198 [Aphanomyces astaci]|eukprot:XP_009821066.1 hypothetical protein H257_00198 [Aphanomyces astaci]
MLRPGWTRGIAAVWYMAMNVGAQKDVTTFLVIGPSANQTETSQSINAVTAHDSMAFTLTMQPYSLPVQSNDTQWLIPPGDSTPSNDTTSKYKSFDLNRDSGDNTQVFVQVIILDESQLIPNSNCSNATSSCDWATSDASVTDQLTWLNSTLSQSQAQWLFVVGQRPLCYRDRKGLYQNMHATLLPLFTAYQVDAYFGMDDLVSQVVHLPVGSSPFFTSYTYGAATSMPYMDMLASCESVYRVPAGNTTYTTHELSMNTMDVTMFNSQGGVVYRTMQTRLRKQFEGKGSVGPPEFVPWLTGGAVILTVVVAIVYGLKFKGKRIDYRYNPCFKRQVAQAKVDTDGSGSRSTNDLPTDADDEEEEDEFDMDFSSDDEETSVVSGTTL